MATNGLSGFEMTPGIRPELWAAQAVPRLGNFFPDLWLISPKHDGMRTLFACKWLIINCLSSFRRIRGEMSKPLFSHADFATAPGAKG